MNTRIALTHRKLRSVSKGAQSALRPLAKVVAKATLATLDRSHEIMLRIRPGERAAPRTVRIRFTEEQRRRISARQGNLCMYCGVRLNRNILQLDHIYPVEFGGPNEESNLQALCGRCNARKGVQIDADFRERYREVLGDVPVGQPPNRRIPYERFDAITKRTRQGETTRVLRRSVFRTPRQKIASGSGVLGAIIGGAWFIVMALLLEGWPVGQYVAFFGAIAIGVSAWLGSIQRAKRTGVWYREE